MKSYKFKARDKSGKLKEGIVRADSPQMAAQHFKEAGMVVISLKEQSKGFKFTGKITFGSGIGFKEIMIFTRQMYALCIAGLPIVNSLKSLEQSAQNRAFKIMLGDVRRDIESGVSFSAALGKFPKSFNKIYTSTIRAGEASGSLPEVLKRLAYALEKEEQTKTRIKQALSYPIIVLVVIIGAILAIGIFVLPRFAALFNSFGADLPIFTRILIAANDFLRNFWYVCIIIIGALIFAFRSFISTPVGKQITDRLILRVPIFGDLYMKIYMGRFARTIATLIKSGVPIVEALDLAGKTCDNIILGKAMENIKDNVREGKSIARSMREETVFPDLIVQMVSAGEEAGRVDELMEMVADYYDREADYTIGNLTLLLEPFLLVFIAAIVLVLALGVFLPLWSMSSVVR